MKTMLKKFKDFVEQICKNLKHYLKSEQDLNETSCKEWERFNAKSITTSRETNAKTLNKAEEHKTKWQCLSLRANKKKLVNQINKDVTGSIELIYHESEFGNITKTQA